MKSSIYSPVKGIATLIGKVDAYFCWLAIFFISSCMFNATGQTLPVNLGFETSTFLGWTGATGQCCPVYAPNIGLDTSRHVITAGNFTDPYSNSLIPVVAPNNIYSARLGNENNSAESEMLEYSFTVPSDSFLLKINFAVLLENGLHPASKQPRFSYRVVSASSPLSGCTAVDIIAGGGEQDTILNGNLELYYWQSRIVNLIGHVGENINIRFETGDCGPGGHFGYAYVDCELVHAPHINTTCNPNGSITITAPPALGGNWHDGTVGDTLIIENPISTGDYFLELNAGTICNFKLPLTINHLLPFANFTAITECEQNVTFNNFSQFNAGSVWLWNFGDGITSNYFTPVHQYQQPGNFTVIFSVNQTNNCKSADSLIIAIDSENNLSIDAGGVCRGEIITLKPDVSHISTPINNFNWYIDNLFHDNNYETSEIFFETGFHQIMLITEDQNGCFDTTYSNLEIKEDNSCFDGDFPIYVPNAFTPNGDGKNDKFEISSVEFLNNAELLITDRFGKLIPVGDFWDGTFEGNQCPEGIYIYQFTYNYQKRSKIINGTIALIR